MGDIRVGCQSLGKTVANFGYGSTGRFVGNFAASVPLKTSVRNVVCGTAQRPRFPHD